MYDITALGEILIDFTCQGDNPDGRRLFVQNPGGAPANVLTAAAKLGARTAFLGKAGSDMHGQFLKEVLQAEGIETKGFLLDDNYYTTLAFVALSATGERTFSFARKPGADTQISREEIDLNILKNSRIFHVGSLSLTDEPARDAVLFAVRTARENGVIISYDPNYRATLWPDEETAMEQMRSLVPYVDVMKISDEETTLLTGETDPETAAEQLCKMGVHLAVVTMGSKGAYVRTKEGGVFVPGFKSRAVDTTGAGDSFWGAFLYRISEFGMRPAEIALGKAGQFAYFSNAAASLCVEKKGGIPAMPGIKDVRKRLQTKQPPISPKDENTH